MKNYMHETVCLLNKHKLNMTTEKIIALHDILAEHKDVDIAFYSAGGTNKKTFMNRHKDHCAYLGTTTRRNGHKQLIFAVWKK